MSPKGAILLQSPGRKPWVNHWNTFIEPLQGRHFLTQGCVWSLCCIYSLGHWLAKVSAAPTELNLLLSAFPQGFISGFALISPWALQEYRPFRARCRIGCVYPGFHIELRPYSTLGFAGVSPLQGSLSYCLCIPRVSYRALPSFHPGLCRSAALSGLVDVFINYLLLLMCLSDTGRNKPYGLAHNLWTSPLS